MRQKIKRSNWSQSEEKHSRISLFCLQSCGMIIHKKNDGVFDIDNMPLTEEPECVINDLNLYSKIQNLTTLSYDSQSYDSLELYIYRSRRRKLFPIFVNFQIYRLKQVSDMKALLITALFMGFISVNNASAAEEIHHADGKVDDQVLIAE